MVDNNEIDVSFVQPTIYGNILAKDVEVLIKDQTCLISVMMANNEVPIINNVKEIGLIAHKYNKPFHSDCVQVFGKFPIDMIKHNVDVITASGHKFYAPKGIALLIINNDLIKGYDLTSEIGGSQQHELRGGTENVQGIACIGAALKYVFKDRKKKNDKLRALRGYLLSELKKYYVFGNFSKYVYNISDDDDPYSKQMVKNTNDDNDNKTIDYDNKNNDNVKIKSKIKFEKDIEILSLGAPEENQAFILPNALLLSVCKNRGKPFCNIELKKYLDSKGIGVSIGSVCLTKNDKASHVLDAIMAPPVVKRGVIRISFGDQNSKMEIDYFITVFMQGIDKQCDDLD